MFIFRLAAKRKVKLDDLVVAQNKDGHRHS